MLIERNFCFFFIQNSCFYRIFIFLSHFKKNNIIFLDNFFQIKYYLIITQMP